MTAWPEPLTATADSPDGYTVLVTARDGAGGEVARVACSHNAAAGYGVFGEMRVTDAGGTARQRVRALVLLVREAYRFAAEHGVLRAHTEAPVAMATFAARLSGMAGVPAGGRLVFGGEVQAMRSAALAATDADGNFTGADASSYDATL